MALRRRKPEATPMNEFVPPEDPQKLVTWLNEKRDKGRTRTPESQMKLNLAYVLGQQMVVWDQNAKRLRAPDIDTSDPNAPVRVPINKIGEIVEHFIARLTKSAPEPTCRPVTDDDDDVGAAKAGTRILLSEEHRIGWDSLMMMLYFWVVPLGFAYLHICWDPDEGDEVGSLDGAKDEEPETINEGQIRVEIVPAFELAVDPNAKTLQDARWAVRTLTMTKEAVWEAYGVMPAADAVGKDTTLVDDVYTVSQSRLDSRTGANDNVSVHQLWMLPGRASAKGMVVTWCGSQILEDPMPFPYRHGRLPFEQFDLLPGIGTREGRTWVTDLVPIQNDYNDARSREAELRRTLVPKLLYPKGSIKPEALTTRVQAIGYNAIGDKPTVHVPDSGWIAQFENGMNRADMEMGSRAGQSDVSSGKPASASMPAAAIIALQETDDTKMAVTSKLMVAAQARAGWQILMLAKQYWTEKRLVRTWSEAGTLEVAQFSQSDLQDQLDVHIDADSALPRSKSARVQLAMDLLGLGPVGSPMSPFTDWRAVFRMLDQPGTDFIVDSLNEDAKQACRENDLLMQGIECPVHAWETHAIHWQEHNRQRKGEAYAAVERRALAGDPEAARIQAVFDAHAETHAQFMLPQAGVPTPPGSPYTPDDPATGPRGLAQDPEAAALDAGPPPGVSPPPGPKKQEQKVAKRAGIGGPGQPGRVPGIPVDVQADSMGA